MARFYITTPIYYVNDRPHIGHAYTTVAADVAARWRRMRGEEVCFLTGTDEHGQKVMQAAAGRGVSPQAHCDEMSAAFRALWVRLNVRHDDYIRTTEDRHKAVVQACLQGLYERGELYKAPYSGWYSTAAERFWTEDELKDGNCPDTGKPVEWVTEHNWFFRMSAWQPKLLEWIAANPACIQPESRRNEVLGFLAKPINDLCISRPASRLPWGIPLPFDGDYTTYVWFDALTNYISALGGPGTEAFSKFWPADFHLVGKDILTFHTVYWFSMLLAQGITPPAAVYAHGWWLVEGKKMSKSLGNVVAPDLLIDAYGADAVRYFLLREIPFGYDGEFYHASFLTRYNADLANDLGNLAHRALSMTGKWLGGAVQAAGPREGTDEALWALAARATATFDDQLCKLQFREALEALWELISAGNKYLDTEGPWTLNKNGQHARLGTVLRNALEVCRIAASHLSCVCPEKGRELLAKLGCAEIDLSPALDRLSTGQAVEAGEPLFPRLMELPEVIRAKMEEAGLTTAASTPKSKLTTEQQKAEKKAEKKQEPNAEKKAEKKAEPKAEPQPEKQEGKMSEQSNPAPAEAAPAPVEITYDDFAKLQLRTGKVVEAARHPKADRLLVLKVDIGEAQPRQIVAGIAAVYAPEALVGQQIVVVANLKPAKLRGIESQGMLLAAGGPEVAALVRPAQELPPGTVVK